MAREKASVIALHGDVSNAGESTIVSDAPVICTVLITGTSPILFHRWQSDEVEAKSAVKKGSLAKKTDNIESYVYRDSSGNICLPGEYLRGSLIDPKNGAAKYRQDPRSPRKSALDLFRAGVQSLTDLAPIKCSSGTPATEWDFVDRRRAVVQRNGITRSRPGFDSGWSCEVHFLIITPGLIPPHLLHETLVDAGRLVGVGDFRPTYGRFAVNGFSMIDI
jgi:hypothetical protein